VRELSPNELGDYKSGELSVLSDHLFESQSITQMAYQQNPFEILWCLRDDGVLLALTYMQEHKVVAWSRHTSGTVVSIATIPGTYETELWAAINRTINNNTHTYIERLSSFAQQSFNNSTFMDSHILRSNNAGFTSIPLPHLSNQTVQYVSTSATGNGTVTSNNLSVPNTTRARAGLAYVSDLETLPVSPELKSGDTMFKTKRIVEIQVRCRNSAGGSYGPDAYTLTPLFGNTSFADGHRVGLSRREGFNSAATEKTVYIRQTDPLPLNIDAIGMDVEVE
jgi:hypothetical protein